MKLRLTDIAPEPYEHLGARLLHLCHHFFEGNTHIDIAVAFADRDGGAGNALLWLTKHFGVFPVEIGRHDGEASLRELARIRQQPALTLFVQGLPLPEPESLRNRTDDAPADTADESDPTTEGNILNHLPILVGLKDPVARTTAQRLFQQISVNSQFLLAENKADGARPVIYVAGFNVVEGFSKNTHLPFVNILPWYLLLSDGIKKRRIFRQPGLDRFLEKLPTDNPNIIDLEAIIDNMEADPYRD